jgi:hypothetical protein
MHYGTIGPFPLGKVYTIGEKFAQTSTEQRKMSTIQGTFSCRKGVYLPCKVGAKCVKTPVYVRKFGRLA